MNLTDPKFSLDLFLDGGGGGGGGDFAGAPEHFIT